MKGVSDSGSMTPLISQTTHLGSKQMKLKTGENNNNKDRLTTLTSPDPWPCPMIPGTVTESSCGFFVFYVELLCQAGLGSEDF